MAHHCDDLLCREPARMGSLSIEEPSMIEPRAWQQCSACKRYGDLHCGACTPLTTVADVLAALRQPSEAMIAAGWIDKDDVTPDEIFLAMLDAFEKDQSSPAKKAYEAANPLGGPARMFDAIAERIRSGEDYYAVLADYGVTVEEK